MMNSMMGNSFFSPHIEVKIFHMQNIFILYKCKSLDFNLISENVFTNHP
jgi:hypothetical protein